MASIGTLAVNIIARTEKFRQGVGKSLSLTSKFSSGISRATGVVSKFSGVLAAGAGFVGFSAGIAKAADEVDRLTKFARRLDILPGQLGGIQMAARQMSGMMEGSLNTALQRMVRRISEAAKGAGEAKGALKELRLDAARLNRLTVEDRFYAIADAMAAVDNQADRVRLAMRLFDTEGVGLVNTLKDGSGAIRNYVKEYKRLGGSFTFEDAEKVEKMNDELDRLKTIMGATFKDIVIDISPAASEALTGLREAMQGVKLLSKGSKGSEADSEYWQGVRSRFFGRRGKFIYDQTYGRIARGAEMETEPASPERMAKLLGQTQIPQGRFDILKGGPIVSKFLADAPGKLADGLQMGTQKLTEAMGAAGKAVNSGKSILSKEYADRVLGQLTFGLYGKSGPQALQEEKAAVEREQRERQQFRSINSALQYGSREAAVASRQRNPMLGVAKDQLKVLRDISRDTRKRASAPTVMLAELNL